MTNAVSSGISIHFRLTGANYVTVSACTSSTTAMGIAFRMALPNRRFHRHIGVYANHFFAPDGRPMGKDEWTARQHEWLPTDEDRAHVKRVQTPVSTHDQMAHWIAPPHAGIKGLPWQYEYVKRAV